MTRIEKIKLTIFIVLRVIVIIAGVLAVYNSDWTNFTLAVLTLVVLFLPTLIERKLHLDFPGEFDILIVVFIFAALYLGEIQSFYFRFWWWDIFLHTLSGLIIGAIGFSLVYILNSHDNVSINLSKVFVSIFSFCFALSIGAIWEIFEFSMDSFFGLNMQKSGLVDTMWDLIVDAAGALIFSILGYLYLGGNMRILDKFISKIVRKYSNSVENDM